MSENKFTELKRKFVETILNITKIEVKDDDNVKNTANFHTKGYK